MSRTLAPIDADAALRTLFLTDLPNVLSLSQVSRACGMSETWAYERVRRGELQLLPISGQKLISKHQLLTWLGADKLVEALASPARRNDAETEVRP